MRMAQPGGDPPLAQGALALLVGLVGTHPDRREDLLDGDLPPQQLVAGQPDRAHPATAELRLQPVSARDETAGRGDRTGHLVIDAVQTPDGTPNRRTYSS